MRVEKNKAFAYRFYRPFTQQCKVCQILKRNQFNIKRKEKKAYKYISWVCQNSQVLSKTENPILEKVPLNSTKDAINYGEDTLAQLLPLSSETEE